MHFIGLIEKAIHLLSNYLTGRRQKVVINGEFSNILEVSSGVPQGSILGPLLYSVYTCNFLLILHTVNNTFTDDTQLYYSFNVRDIPQVNDYVNSDLSNIARAAAEYSLYLNSNKSALIVFGKKTVLREVEENISLTVGDVVLTAVSRAVQEIKKLGVIIDTKLRLIKQVSNMIRKAYFLI